MKTSPLVLLVTAAVLGTGATLAHALPPEIYTPPQCTNDLAQNEAAGYKPAASGPWTKCEMNLSPARAAAGEQGMEVILNASNFSGCGHYLYFYDGTIHRSGVAKRPSDALKHAGCDWLTIGDAVVSMPGARRVFRCMGAPGGTITNLTFDYGLNSSSCIQ
jgi:hypothetical protein